MPRDAALSEVSIGACSVKRLSHAHCDDLTVCPRTRQLEYRGSLRLRIHSIVGMKKLWSSVVSSFGHRWITVLVRV